MYRQDKIGFNFQFIKNNYANVALVVERVYTISGAI